ncbi:MAG TPA: hypothetical protein VII99_11850, partial [Bacteroidia bacterium]
CSRLSLWKTEMSALFIFLSPFMIIKFRQRKYQNKVFISPVSRSNCRSLLTNNQLNRVAPEMKKKIDFVFSAF